MRLVSNVGGRAQEPLLTETRDDQELMLAVCGGDQHALGALYGKYGVAVKALGRRFRLPEAELDDVVQELFLEAWEKASEFDPRRGAVLTWLAVRLRSRCIDSLRKTARRGELLEANAAALRPREATPQELAAERTRLRDAVLGLDEDLRKVTQLAYFEGASTLEISEQLGLAHGTVKSRMRRAREVLYVALTTGSV